MDCFFVWEVARGGVFPDACGLCVGNHSCSTYFIRKVVGYPEKIGPFCTVVFTKKGVLFALAIACCQSYQYYIL